MNLNQINPAIHGLTQQQGADKNRLMNIQPVHECQMQHKYAKGIADMVEEGSEVAALPGISGVYAVARIQYDPGQE